MVVAPMPDRRTPWWLWPNLLSLDAPLVAVAWLYMFARAWRVDYLAANAYLALGLAVWVIYVLDRLFDLKLREGDDPTLGGRHRFHGRHRGAFLVAVAIALGLLAWIVFGTLPVAIFSYAWPGFVLVMAFFTLVVFAAMTREIPYMRNLVAGTAFAYGTAMMAHVFLPGIGWFQMLLTPELVCFAVLCALNITAIHLWEHSRRSDDPEVKAGDELSLTLPLTLLAAGALFGAFVANRGSVFEGGLDGAPSRIFFYAILVSAALLQVVNRNRRRFSLDAQRTLADVAMLVPLPLFLTAGAG